MSDARSWMRRIRCEPLDHGLACYPPGTSIGPRQVQVWQFVWLARGDATWTVDGRQFPAPEGSVLLARPGTRDLLRWDPVRRTFHGWVAFRLRGSRPPAMPVVLRRPGPDDILLPLLRHVRRLMADRPPGWEEMAGGALRQALLAFISGSMACDGEEADDTPALVDHALEWLAGRWAAAGAAADRLGACLRRLA